MTTIERWGSGEAYEAYVGRWSRLVAREFLSWLSPAPQRAWLDVGCGTGVVTATILDGAEPTRITGVDPSEAHIAHARSQTNDPRAEFHSGDAASIPADTDAFDYVVSGLVLNFVPDPAAALLEMSRVAKPGGTVAAYVWDYAEGMELMRLLWDAAAELDPRAAELDEGKRFSITAPERLASTWRDADLRDVEVTALTVPTKFRDFDDYWTPFLGGHAPAPGYVMSLAEDERERLRVLLRDRLPTEADGSIRLTAKAWAVRGGNGRGIVAR
ncbi:MAG: class I SAM-dependent methyltransferase [Actinomycetota bacterium]